VAELGGNWPGCGAEGAEPTVFADPGIRKKGRKSSAWTCGLTVS
jgi:hypothetical protein